VPEVERVTSAVFGGFAPSAKCQTAVAFAVNTPTLLLLIVTVQVAVLPFTCGLLQVLDIVPGAGETFGVIDVSVAVVPAAGEATEVIVNVCGEPTSFTSFGVIDTFAFTYRLVAGPVPPGPLFPDVERVTSAVFGGLSLSAKCQIAVAFAVNTPTLVLLIVSVQVAVLPFTCGLAQVVDCDVGAGETLGVIDVSVGVVPSGSATDVIVNTCWLPTSFTSFGVIETFAFT